MEWGKVKSILICLFLILNVVLAISIVGRYFDRRIGNEVREEIEQIIARRGITFEGGLSFEMYSARRLIYEDNSASVLEIAANLYSDGASIQFTGPESFLYSNANPRDKSVAGDGESGLDEAIRSVLGQAGIDIAEFVTDEILVYPDGGRVFRYIRVFERKYVFDSNIAVFVNPVGGIEHIHVSYRGVRGFSDEAEMSMIPAYQVFLRNSFQEGQVISSIDIGYLGLQDPYYDGSYMESMEGAVWRVRLGDGGERFFEGAFGDEITYVPM